MLFLLFITCHPLPSFLLPFPFPVPSSPPPPPSTTPPPPPRSASRWAADGRRRCFLTSDTDYFLPPAVDDDTCAACRWSGGGVKDAQGHADAHRLCYPQGGEAVHSDRSANGSTGGRGGDLDSGLLAALWAKRSNHFPAPVCFLVVHSGKEELGVTRQ